MDKNEQKQVVETMQTPGWAVLVAKFSEISSHLAGRIAPMAQNNTMLAEKIVAKQNYELGRVVGMKMFLGHPEQVMQGLEEDAKEERAKR